MQLIQRFLREQGAITLVETLIAVAILAVAIVSAVSVLMVGQSSTHYILKWEEQTQTLRTAMQQIANDLAYAQWSDLTAANQQEFTVVGYRPRVPKDEPNPIIDPYWNNLPDWPGDLGEWPPIPEKQVSVRYILQGSDLIREVSNEVFGIISRRAIVSGLVPYNASLGGSYLEADPSTHLIRVMLRSEREKAGVNSIADEYAEFYIALRIEP